MVEMFNDLKERIMVLRGEDEDIVGIINLLEVMIDYIQKKD
jgi:hypothetical protein